MIHPIFFPVLLYIDVGFLLLYIKLPFTYFYLIQHSKVPCVSFDPCFFLWFIFLLKTSAQLGLGCLQLCNNEKSVFLVTIVVLYNNWQFKQHIIRYSQFIVRYFLGRFFIEVWFYLFIFDYTSVLICVCAVVYPCYLHRCGGLQKFL